MALAIAEKNIRALTKHAKPRIISGIVDNQQAIFDGGIDTPLRLCHFLAQLAHESAHFQVTLEFASGKAYERRQDLGNTKKGDGPRYRGRGLIQTTGRANYRQATAAIKALNNKAPNFEDNPEALEQFPWALLAGITYWQKRKINAAADQDDVVRVTKLINGGKNGLDDRIKYLKIARKIWLTGDAAPEPDDANPLLQRGDKGHDVTILQNELIQAGLKVLADGHFGQITEHAVKTFQASQGLKDNGIVDRPTWDALRAN
jgi:putative chitinase